MTFLRAHWPVFAALALGLALGWQLHRPAACPPAVHVVEAVRGEKDKAAVKDSETQQAASTKTVFEFAPPECPPKGNRAAEAAPLGSKVSASGAPATSTAMLADHGPLVKVTVTETGPRETTSHAETASHATEERHTEVQITPTPPAPLPRFSVSYAPRVLPSVGLGIVGAGVRVVGGTWIEAWAEPTAPALGLGIRLTF